MGQYRRALPVFNEYGDADPIAYGVGSDQVVPTWLTVDDTLDNGRDDGSVSRSPADSRTELPDPPNKPYQVDVYRDQRGCALAENWVVHGESHAWAGGAQTDPTDVVSDPLAPDATTAMYRFFTSPDTLGGSTRCA
jgi:poly(3-hydroxybutyrate) depolymerase